MFALELLLVALALFGNVAVWIALFNAFHARHLPRWLTQTISNVSYCGLAVAPALLVFWYLSSPARLVDMLAQRQMSVPLLLVVACWIAAIVALPLCLRQLNWRRYDRNHAVLLSNHTTHVDTLVKLGSRYDGQRWVTRLARLPGNQILDLAIHDKRIRVPRWPQALDGVTIAHLSDLHFTGKVGKAFFEDVVDRTNEMDADLIAITGDLVDNQQCFDWIGDTLGRLEARGGVYFVLGNHDLRVDSRQLRSILVEHGLVDLGGRWLQVEVAGAPIILAGNELPWFSPAANLDNCPPRDRTDGPPRIVLAHSPDQLDWARRHDADLMLAGHTHGGQIRLPIIGPIISPSRMGTRYAAGTFYQSPTVMHVSRGLSGTVPVRLNCPPELSKLILLAPQ